MANPDHEKLVRDALREGVESADFSGFDLSGLLLSSARLQGANLSGADLGGADLSGGYFRGCNLSNARLSKARIVLGDFREADLSGADLTKANLDGSILSGAKLTGAKLIKARLVKAHLSSADLTGANLKQADLRGTQGLTDAQLGAAIDSEKAILDERMLAVLRRSGDIEVARHGRHTQNRASAYEVDLMFGAEKPLFGDVFVLCGYEHPKFPPTGRFKFDELADLGFEQVDDYWAIRADGEPVVWLFPLVRGEVVHHHSGPYDGVRLDLADRAYRRLWKDCAARFRATLQIAG